MGDQRIAGLLTSDNGSANGSDDPLHDAVSLTVLAGDVAYPAPVLGTTCAAAPTSHGCTARCC